MRVGGVHDDLQNNFEGQRTCWNYIGMYVWAECWILLVHLIMELALRYVRT